MDLEAKGGITNDLETNKQFLHQFWKHVLKLSTSSIFKSKLCIFMVLSQESYSGFKKCLSFWKAKLLLPSLFKLFSCHPEAATPYLAAKHLRVNSATEVFKVSALL